MVSLKINENAVSVTGYTGTETELVIPSEIEGLDRGGDICQG